MNNDKYRIYLRTRAGSQMIANGTSVNGLLTQIGDFLEGVGKDIKDDQLISLTMQTLDPNGGLISEERGPVEKRKQIAKVAEALGAR